MSDSALLERTRVLLLGLSGLMFGATIVELVFAEHTDGLLQLLPFACCAIGLLMIVLVWRNREPSRVRMARIVLALIAAASVFGMAEHLWNAYLMTRDFHPGIGGWDLVETTLTSSIPLLAPGALAAGAFVAMVATYGLGTNPNPAHATCDPATGLIDPYAPWHDVDVMPGRFASRRTGSRFGVPSAKSHRRMDTRARSEPDEGRPCTSSPRR